LANPPRNVYWDTCTWLGLINQEADKIGRCRHIVAEARAGNIQIWTSAFTLAEVFKKNCNGTPAGLAAAKDADFEQYIEQDFLTIVQVDYDIGVQARRLLRTHTKLKKPADAIHLATAVLSNVEELHTFDADNLTPLSGQVNRQDGVALTICFPPEPPPPPTPAPMPLFDTET
jgi:predicted nucleic acid-binding protein